ncbi:MAG: hypothetical protein AVDCRST_MAG86-2398, partial [uncultured Truepera sp.]
APSLSTRLLDVRRLFRLLRGHRLLGSLHRLVLSALGPERYADRRPKRHFAARDGPSRPCLGVFGRRLERPPPASARRAAERSDRRTFSYRCLQLPAGCPADLCFRPSRYHRRPPARQLRRHPRRGGEDKFRQAARLGFGRVHPGRLAGRRGDGEGGLIPFFVRLRRRPHGGLRRHAGAARAAGGAPPWAPPRCRAAVASPRPSAPPVRHLSSFYEQHARVHPFWALRPRAGGDLGVSRGSERGRGDKRVPGAFLGRPTRRTFGEWAALQGGARRFCGAPTSLYGRPLDHVGLGCAAAARPLVRLLPDRRNGASPRARRFGAAGDRAGAARLGDGVRSDRRRAAQRGCARVVRYLHCLRGVGGHHGPRVRRICGGRAEERLRGAAASRQGATGGAV